MERLKQKKCTRCSGSLVIEADHRGWYVVCLQCGNERLLEAVQARSRVDFSRRIASHA